MDYKRQTTRSDESSKTINLFSQEDNSEKASLSIDYSSDPETSGTSKSIEFSLGQQVSNVVRQLEQIIPKIDDAKIKEQVEELEFYISRFLEVAHQIKGDVPIPPLYASLTEESSVLIEWIFPDFRIGFNIEANPDESGVHIVAGKRLNDFIYSEKLKNIQDVSQVLVRYVLSNI